jgi:TATA-box binding protein (TBP) (component of TFIID and TFIIIB)
MTHGGTKQQQQQQHTPLHLRGMTGGVKYELHPDVKNYKDTHPNVENMVSVVKARASVNLSLVCSKLLASEFRPNRFAAATIRIGSSTVLFYSTGKLLVAGSKCIEQSMFLSHLYSIIIGLIRQRSYAYDKRTKRIKSVRWTRLCRRLRFGNMKIENIVGMLRFDRRLIDLEHIYRTNPYETSYSQTFPSVRSKLQGFTALIFDSGYVLFLGLKDMESLRNAYTTVNDMITRAHRSVGGYDAVKYLLWRRRLAIESREDARAWKRPLQCGAMAAVPATAPLTGAENSKTHRNEHRIQQYHFRTMLRHTPIGAAADDDDDAQAGEGRTCTARYLNQYYGDDACDASSTLRSIRRDCPGVFRRMTTTDFKDDVMSLCLAADLNNAQQVQRLCRENELLSSLYRL